MTPTTITATIEVGDIASLAAVCQSLADLEVTDYEISGSVSIGSTIALDDDETPPHGIARPVFFRDTATLQAFNALSALAGTMPGLRREFISMAHGLALDAWALLATEYPEPPL